MSYLGYLVKDSAFEELNQAVKTVMANRPYLSAVITGTLVEDFVRQTSARDRAPLSPIEMLTAREQEVLRMLWISWRSTAPSSWRGMLFARG